MLLPVTALSRFAVLFVLRACNREPYFVPSRAPHIQIAPPRKLTAIGSAPFQDSPIISSLKKEKIIMATPTKVPQFKTYNDPVLVRIGYDAS
jgi:hypothetical protein